nr:MAG: hypothetical protein DI620_00265 [Haemophilus parainfluenzae]
MQFDLSRMIQWAYDNDHIDESIIAYQYAKLADIDSNAKAFLAHNSQVKYVKECARRDERNVYFCLDSSLHI